MKRNDGFSLVELMVALVIGLIIILGAGQLFLTVFQTNRQVEMLSEKQAAITFLTEDLIREVRRGEFDPSDYQLARVEEGSDAAMLEKKDVAGNFQALVGGMIMPTGSGDEVSFSDPALTSVDGAVTTFNIDLEALDGGPEGISFNAVNRTVAAARAPSTDPDTTDPDPADPDPVDPDPVDPDPADPDPVDPDPVDPDPVDPDPVDPDPVDPDPVDPDPVDPDPVDPDPTDPDPDGDGYDEDGNRVYSDDCYHHRHGFRPDHPQCEADL